MPDTWNERIRVPLDASERMVEVERGLHRLARMLVGHAGDEQAGHFAGALAWRLLLVREMALSSPGQAKAAESWIDSLSVALEHALAAATPGLCRDLDEALTDIATILADVADAAGSIAATA